MMSQKKYVVELSVDEREHLKSVISKGKAAARATLKARILLMADQGSFGEGWTDDRICQALETNQTMVARVRRQLVEQGVTAVLTRKKRKTPPIQPDLRRASPGAAHRARLLDPAAGARALEHPPAGRQGGGAEDRRARPFSNTVGRALKKTISSRI